MNRFCKASYAFAFLFAAHFLGCAAARAEEIKNEDCFSCHDTFAAATFTASIHGSNDCVSCHGDIKELPHPDKLSAVKCAGCHEKEAAAYAGSIHGTVKGGTPHAASCVDCHGSHEVLPLASPQSKMYHFNVPATCGGCHREIVTEFERSVHGKAVKAGKFESPVCTDCHGEHTIKSHLDPSSKIYTTTVSEKTCGACHAAEKIVSKYRLPSDRLQTFLESYHGLASRQGITTVANCASCHGAHDILPSSDPASSVHKKNLPQTCGQCHPNVSGQLAKGSVHLAPSLDRDRAVYLVSVFYVFLIIVVIGGMVLHNLLDFLAKLKEHYAKKKEKNHSLCFTLNERIQHLVLFITFALLAYTGFALKFPEAWWALPFTAWDPTHRWRGWVHRACAILFSSLCVYHFFYVCLAPRGRGQLKSLAPKRKDFSDLVQTVRHNLGISKNKPVLARYSYVENAEYWALVWGSAVMILTGVLLTFENISMRLFPKWALDVATVIHYYEAVLATLAILVWHFYFTIFDPEHYPMNWSMWTGRSGEEKDEK